MNAKSPRMLALYLWQLHRACSPPLSTVWVISILYNRKCSYKSVHMRSTSHVNCLNTEEAIRGSMLRNVSTIDHSARSTTTLYYVNEWTK